MKTLLLLTFFILSSASVNGCFIIISKKDGRVLVGNNEDWYHSDAKYWIEAPIARKKEKFAALFFGFKGELTTAQGGFNDHGLFFDATAVPKLEMNEARKEGREKAIHPVFKNILKQCATVEEAVTLLEKYYIPFIRKVQIVLADATGAYVVMNVNGIVEKGALTEGYRIITNFHTDDKHHFCYRYDSAAARLEKHFENSPEEIQSILSLSHQEFPGATVYSNVYNLTDPSVQIFYNHRFDQSLTADFQKLPAGKSVYLEEAFPQRMIPVLIKKHKRKGVQAALTFFRTACQDPERRYQCDVEQLSDLTTRLLNQRHFDDAYTVATENLRLYPSSDKAHEQLAKSLMYTGRIDEGLKEYEKALALNPGNRWAVCVLNQYRQRPSGEIHLTLKAYENAKLVSVSGAFNEWQALQNICFKNPSGEWECQLSLPPGNYPYRFVVDGIFIDDPAHPPTREVEKGFFASELKVP